MKRIFFIGIIGIFVIGILAFQPNEKTDKKLSDEEKIQQRLEEKIKMYQKERRLECEKRALKKAIPIVDSLIAETYAKDLRASDFIIERPKKPEKPTVKIEPFPFDSIE